VNIIARKVDKKDKKRQKKEESGGRRSFKQKVQPRMNINVTAL
jgi:hypothetical protein